MILVVFISQHSENACGHVYQYTLITGKRREIMYMCST